VDFDYLNTKPVVPRASLLHGAPSLQSTAWATQASGVRLPPNVATELERVWETQTGLAGALLPTAEVVDEERLPEGAVRRVTVNAYERNPVARSQCLLHHGYACAVCGILMREMYGPIAENFIEVHHLRPLAEVGREYEVDPVKDLRPICPNCHAIVHRMTPAMRIDEAKQLVAKNRAR
jgi:5-methylcytosine-specific restriction protein A